MEQACAKVWGKKKGEENEGAQLLGTAFFISKQLLITCKHVVETLEPGCTLSVKLYVGHIPLPVKYLCHDERDLAILQLGEPAPFEFEPITLAAQDPLSMPESGDAQAFGFTIDTSAFEAKPCRLIPYSDSYEKIRFEPEIPIGYSGGVLINEQNQCIGVVMASLDSTQCSYAVPIYQLRYWLQQQGISLQHPALEAWQIEYLETLKTNMAELRSESLIQQLDQSNSDVPPVEIYLRDIYVPLSIEGGTPKNMEEQGSHHLQNGQQQSAVAAIAQHRYCVLKGDPGCGKTTFTRYWCLRLAVQLTEEPSLRQEEEELPPELVNAFPVHIELDRLYPKLAEYDSKSLSVNHINQALSQYFTDDCLPFNSVEPLFKLDSAVLWLFDGLDEVRISDTDRTHFLEALNRWLERLKRHKQHFVCMTTRPYAYPQGRLSPSSTFRAFRIRELKNEHCFQFIQQFFRALGGAQDQSGQLIQILQYPERSHLLELCHNPLLLTLTSILYHRDGEKALPNDRAGLYELCIERVLDRWERKLRKDDPTSYSLISPDQGREKIASRETVHNALDKLAYHAHYYLTQNDKESRYNGDIPKLLVQEHFFPFFTESDITEPEIEDYLYNRTGVLIDRGGEHYAFMHRTFREYLAARYVLLNINLGLVQQFAKAVQQDPGWWREVLALLARLGDRPTKSGEREPMLGSTELLMACLPYASNETDSNTSDAPTPHSLILACANAEVERDANLACDNTSTQAWRKRLQNWLIVLIEQAETPVEFKAEAGRQLSWLGDPRPGTGSRVASKAANGHKLPDILWAKIPVSNAGEPEIKLEDTDLPPFPIDQEFQVATYPITHCQFQSFLDHPEGYQNPDWWQGFEDQLRSVKRSHWEEPNHPRTNVDWFEASAFCRWLTAMYQANDLLPIANGVIRLPWEWEWQYLACSTHSNQKYPWGNEYQRGFANITEEIEGGTTLGRTTAVGIYIGGKSEQQVFDLAGNVWEWCGNDYDNPTTNQSYSEEWKSLRGGAWSFNASSARAAYRNSNHPTIRYLNIGFRVVCCPPSLGTDH